MKLGLVLVVVVMIGLLANFALRATTSEDYDAEQRVAGDFVQVKEKIRKLCDYCMKDGIDKDCFILDAVVASGEIDVDSFLENVRLEQNLAQGNHVLKIISENNICVVREIE
ncbi:hypothetical protein JXA85_06640 [Candidatus Woesearchaeota archaeon]|nr:hypothetical protein [Candidatus Woesearchaeota archaeon]